MVIKLCEKWGTERIVVAVDADGDNVAIRGWLKKTSTKPIELVKKMSGIGITRFLYTDINRDGTKQSPNFEETSKVADLSNFPVVISGGVSSIEDIKKSKGLNKNIEGIIVGKAIYDGDIDLDELVKEDAQK